MSGWSAITLEQQTALVLITGFLLSGVLGWVLQRSHFCTMGAISDWLLMNDKTRLRQWALAIAVAALGLGTLSMAGWVQPANSIYGAERFPWLSYVLGGFVFGVGMVLSSGCPTKNLIRLGGGSLKALLVLMVMAGAALATLKGAPGMLRVQVLDTYRLGIPGGALAGQWLSSMTGWPAGVSDLLAALLIAGPLLVWACWPQDRWQGIAPAGLAVGALLLLCWFNSGALGYVPEHPETLEAVFLATSSHRMEGLSFSAPLAQWLDAFLYLSAGRNLTLGMVLVPGVALGAFLSAWRHDQLRWEGFTRTSDLSRHLLGAALMGFGGVCAMGCSFGQGLSGLSTLSWGSMLAVAAMVAGAVTALRVQWWLAEHQA